MNTSEILIKGKALIENPKHYCTGHFIQDEAGRVLFLSSDSEPFAFCSRGAVKRIINNKLSGIYTPAEQALNEAAELILNNKGMNATGYDNSAAYLNNVLGHKYAMEMFDDAIAAALKKEGK